MAFEFNGNIPKNIIFNNNILKKLKYNSEVVWQKTKLPPNYQEVEYIEGTGTQYINLPFGFDNTDTITLKGSITHNEQHTDKFMLAPSIWNNNNNRFAMIGVFDNFFDIAYGSTITTYTQLLPRTPNDKKIYTWIYENYEFKLKELSLSLDVKDITFGGTTSNLKLFYGYKSTTQGKIAYYKHTKINGTTYLFIPCYRKADNKPGLYDSVNKVFYTNAGTGEFNVGADVISSNNYVYGIKRKISNNYSPAWERIEDNYGIVANATLDGTSVFNEFDNLAPWSQIKSCNYDLNTKQVNAWYGDNNFKFDGTNGDVYTYIPKTYWKIYQEDDYDYVLLSDSPRTGFTEVDGFFIARYTGSLVDNVLHSYSGLVPTTAKTIASFRNLANSLGNNFSQLDWRYFVLQMLYLVEYADYNSQAKLGRGIINRKNLRALIAEQNTNRVVISSSSGYYVGQIIRIGTSDGGVQVADARKITNIETYDDGTVTGYALTFDGAAVNIAVNNYVCTMAQAAGQCDSLGMKSGCLYDDGIHSMIYRGVENIFGNIRQIVDGINIHDNVAYICKNHSDYVSNKFETPYKALGYTNASSSTGGFISELGFDSSEPFFRFQTNYGGTSTRYMCDYGWSGTGDKMVVVGGYFTSNLYNGLWSYILNDSPSSSAWYMGCRTLIDNQE